MVLGLLMPSCLLLRAGRRVRAAGFTGLSCADAIGVLASALAWPVRRLVAVGLLTDGASCLVCPAAAAVGASAGLAAAAAC